MTDTELLDMFDASGACLSFTMFSDNGEPLFIKGNNIREVLLSLCTVTIGDEETNDRMKMN